MPEWRAYLKTEHDRCHPKTNSMEYSHSCETNSSSTSQVISRTQQLATCPSREPDRSGLRHRHLSRRTVLILTSLLCPYLPSGLLPSGLRTKTLYTPLLSRKFRMHPPSQSSLLDRPNNSLLAEEHIVNLLIMPSFVTSPLLGPNMLLTILVSDTFVPCFSITWQCRFRSPHKTDKIKVLRF